MNNYPIEYIFQPSPLVYIQGLGKDGIPQGSAKDLKRASTPIVHNPLLINADKINRKQDTVRASSGLELVSLFQKYSITDDCVWDDDLIKSQIGAQVMKYRFRFIDNEFLLPHFANDASSSENIEEEPTTPTNSVKSPLSPFNEASDLFPDGIISANWIQKYKDIVPAVFISVHELNADLAENEIEDNEKELIEEIRYLKNNIVKRGIKFISIVVCSRSSILNPDLIERVTRIKKQTGLQNRNSLLFLPSGTEKELKSFVSQVITMIKPLTMDFYNTVEKKVKRKKSRQSSVQLSQIPQGLIQPFWDARYFIKLALIQEFKSLPEAALKFWEQSYTSLLEIFKSFPKEHQRWDEFRMLLDFIVFHVVRNLLYLEDCSTAFLKFDTHLQNVITFLKWHDIKPKSYPVLTWLKYQFEWFAGLLDYVPKEIIPVEIPYEISNKSRLSMPNPGYLYLQAVSLTEKRRLEANSQHEEFLDTYLSLSAGQEKSFDYNAESINLLKKALLVFNKSGHFKRSENHIKFEIAEFFHRMGRYNDAVEQYEECADFYQKDNGNWRSIEITIAKRIYDCCLKLADNRKAIEYLLKLSTYPAVPSGVEPAVSSETDVLHSQVAIMEAEFFFKNTDIPISEPCQAQLSLQYNLNKLVSDDFKIESFSLQFEENGAIAPIVLEHQEDEFATELQIVELAKVGDKYIGKMNFSTSLNNQVIQFSGLLADKVGKSSLSNCMKVLAKYKGLVTIEFDIFFKHEDPSNRYLWYSKRNETIHKDYFKIFRPLSMAILPRRPEINVVVEANNVFYLGESATIPVIVNNDDHEKVTVYVESVVDFKNHWGENDKFLRLDAMDPSSSISKDLHLQIPHDFEQRSLKFPLKISFFAGENSEVPIQDTVMVNITVLPPLKTKMSVIQRFREQDMPTPFIGVAENGIPIPTRFWCARQVIVATNEIEVIDSSIKLVHSEEFDTEVIDESKSMTRNSDSIIIDEFFSTKSADGAMRREIALVVVNKINWRRKNCDVINEYNSSELKLSLPLFDPRVLLLATEKGDGIELRYIIENPAPKIFQFSTSLIEEEGNPITGDLKNNTFPVLPFTRQELKYSIKTLQEETKLPTMKVYDLHYKLNLPTLPVNDVVEAKGADFVILRKLEQFQ